MSVCDSVTML